MAGRCVEFSLPDYGNFLQLRDAQSLCGMDNVWPETITETFVCRNKVDIGSVPECKGSVVGLPSSSFVYASAIHSPDLGRFGFISKSGCTRRIGPVA